MRGSSSATRRSVSVRACTTRERDELLDRLGYRYAYDLGAEWKEWTGLPVRVRRLGRAAHRAGRDSRWRARSADRVARLGAGAPRRRSPRRRRSATGVSRARCLEYLSGLDYGLSYEHLAGLTEFFRRLVAAGRVPNGTLAFLPAA